MSNRQNELSETYKLGVDIRERETELVGVARDELGFTPKSNGLLGYSTWWNSQRAGAFRYAGHYEGRAAILKVQGVKPDVSEITALEGFKNSNHSQLVRPPELFARLPWDDTRQFEALVVESIDTGKLISYPTSAAEVGKFFELFRDYRANCRSRPWVAQPDSSLAEDVRRTVASNLESAREIYPNHPHRQEADFELIERAVQLLEKFYRDVSCEFQHLHITSDDVFKPSGNDPRHVYTSNFVWGWKAPFFDATAAWHHYGRLLCERASEVDVDVLAQQFALWEHEIYALPKSGEEETQLRHMMLGFTIGALTISDLMIDPDHPMAGKLIEHSRKRAAKLMEQLS